MKTHGHYAAYTKIEEQIKIEEQNIKFIKKTTKKVSVLNVKKVLFLKFLKH